MFMEEITYEKLTSYENLELAFKKARKNKTLKPYVIEFEQNLKENLLGLRTELLMQTYKPRPLTTFILRDPKTRKISKADFRDRVIHHAICNLVEPTFEKTFIYDSYANRIGKGENPENKHHKARRTRCRIYKCFYYLLLKSGNSARYVYVVIVVMRVISRFLLYSYSFTVVYLC